MIVTLKTTASIYEGKTFITELDCEVEAEVFLQDGEPCVDISSVSVDGVDLLNAKNYAVQMIGVAAKHTLSQDDDFQRKCIEQSDLNYIGKGGSDPDAYWRRAG